MENSLNAGQVFKKAWKITTKNAIVLIGLFLAFYIVYFGLSMIAEALKLGMLMTVIMYIISSGFMLGYIRLLLNAYEGNDLEFSVFKLPVKAIGKYIAVNIIVGIIMCILLIPGFLFAMGHLCTSVVFKQMMAQQGTVITPEIESMMSGFGDSMAISIVAFILAMVVVYVSIRLFFTTIAIADNYDISIGESFKKSLRITKGNFWKLVLIYLMCIGVNIVGLILFIAPVIFTMILSLAMIVVTYRMLSEGDVSDKIIDENITPESYSELR